MRIFNPVGEEKRVKSSLVPRLHTLNGKKIALLGNIKLNAKELLVRTGELLKEKENVLKVRLYEKDSPSFGAPESMLSEIAANFDAAVVALGD
ncbi:hypothetical protein ACIFOT_15800 [Neobacillus sp. NRS-1170]